MLILKLSIIKEEAQTRAKSVFRQILLCSWDTCFILALIVAVNYDQ